MRKRNGYKIFKAIERYFDTADQISIQGSAFTHLFDYYHNCGSKEYQAFVRSNRSVHHHAKSYDKRYYCFMEALEGMKDKDGEYPEWKRDFILYTEYLKTILEILKKEDV